MKKRSLTPSPMATWSEIGSAAWLQPFRARIDFSESNLWVYCQLTGKESVADELAPTLDRLTQSGWLSPSDPSGAYRVHPLMHFKLPVMSGTEAAYVHFFQNLGKRWADEDVEGGRSGFGQDFPIREMLNLEHAVALALEMGESLEHLIFALDTGYRMAFARERRIRRLEKLVAILEEKVSIRSNDIQEFDLLGCLDLLAHAYRADKHNERAALLYRQVMDQCERIRVIKVFDNIPANEMLYRSSMSNALIQLASLSRERGDFETGREYWTKAMALARETGLEELLADVLWEAGLWQKAQRKFPESEESLKQALMLTRISFKKGEILVNLAAIADNRGDKAASLELNQQALEVFEPFGDQAPLGAIYTNIGLAYLSLGEWENGQFYAQKALEWFLVRGEWFSVGECFQNLGNLSFARRDLLPAEEYYKKARAAYQRADTVLLVAETLQNEAEVLRLQGNFAAALVAAEQAAELFLRNGSVEGEANARLNGANVLVQEGKLEQALRAFQKALELFEQAGAVSGQGLVHQNLAEVARRQQGYTAGCSHLMLAAELLAQPEAQEHLPRLVAYTNVFSDFFQNKEILNQIAVKLNTLLSEEEMLRVVEQAKVIYLGMSA